MTGVSRLILYLPLFEPLVLRDAKTGALHWERRRVRTRPYYYIDDPALPEAAFDPSTLVIMYREEKTLDADENEVKTGHYYATKPLFGRSEGKLKELKKEFQDSGGVLLSLRKK